LFEEIEEIISCELQDKECRQIPFSWIQTFDRFSIQDLRFVFPYSYFKCKGLYLDLLLHIIDCIPN
jgi:hypothetical protein